MENRSVSINRIIQRLDECFGRNDYTCAEQVLLSYSHEACEGGDLHTELFVQNELMGLYRKTGKQQQAFTALDNAMKTIERLQASEQVGAATTYLNGATVLKAFGKTQESLDLFERAKCIYERELPSNDNRLAGLYNNMGLTLVDLKRFDDANDLYRRAVSVLQKTQDGDLEIAITYLNMATAAECEHGLLEADEAIATYLGDAWALLETHLKRDGYYAFVCEKCASVFGYYGYFVYEKELKERARRIYEGA